MTNEFEQIENEIKNSRWADYSFTDDGQGKKTYTIISGELKQSLRDIVHSTVFGGWQINHTLGRSFIEYKKEQGGKFGLYRKTLMENSPDEFLLVPEGQSSVEKQIFKEAKQRAEASEQRAKESERRIKGSEERAEASEQRAKESEKRLESSSESNNYVSFSVEWNKKGEKISTAEKHFADATQEQAFKESPGWTVAQAVAKAMAEVQNPQNKSSQSQQAQIRQEEPLKIPFFNNPQDNKGGNK